MRLTEFCENSKVVSFDFSMIKNIVALLLLLIVALLLLLIVALLLLLIVALLLLLIVALLFFIIEKSKETTFQVLR